MIQMMQCNFPVLKPRLAYTLRLNSYACYHYSPAQSEFLILATLTHNQSSVFAIEKP
jgi:hypothetical protein